MALFQEPQFVEGRVDECGDLVNEVLELRVLGKVNAVIFDEFFDFCEVLGRVGFQVEGIRIVADDFVASLIAFGPGIGEVDDLVIVIIE